MNLIVLIEHPEVIDMISKCIKLIHEAADISLIKQAYQKALNNQYNINLLLKCIGCYTKRLTGIYT